MKNKKTGVFLTGVWMHDMYDVEEDNWQKRNGSYWDGNGFTWDMAGTGGIQIFAHNVIYNNQL